MKKSSRHQPRHILIVEDNVDDQALLQRALDRLPTHCRFTFTMVSDGLRAQEYFLGENHYSNRAAFPKPALVLSDVMMPICDGFQLLEWIRSREDLSSLPVVLLSSSKRPEDVQRGYRLKANTYFVKPGDLDELNLWASNFAEYWSKHATFPAHS